MSTTPEQDMEEFVRTVVDAGDGRFIVTYDPASETVQVAVDIDKEFRFVGEDTSFVKYSSLYITPDPDELREIITALADIHLALVATTDTE